VFRLGVDKTKDAYRIATERVQAIIDEEFGGEVTIRQRTAIQNDVLLGMFSEDLIAQHLSAFAHRDISLRFEVRSLSGHSGHGRACGWPGLVANDPKRTWLAPLPICYVELVTIALS